MMEGKRLKLIELQKDKLKSMWNDCFAWKEYVYNDWIFVVLGVNKT